MDLSNYLSNDFMLEVTNKNLFLSNGLYNSNVVNRSRILYNIKKSFILHWLIFYINPLGYKPNFSIIGVYTDYEQIKTDIQILKSKGYKKENIIHIEGILGTYLGIINEYGEYDFALSWQQYVNDNDDKILMFDSKYEGDKNNKKYQSMLKFWKDYKGDIYLVFNDMENYFVNNLYMELNFPLVNYETRKLLI